MKRYGDNVTHKEAAAEESSGSEADRDARLFLGGCGATFDLPAPVDSPEAVNAPKNHWLGGLLSFLGVKREKHQVNN
jgi:hypothetical protein